MPKISYFIIFNYQLSISTYLSAISYYQNDVHIDDLQITYSINIHFIFFFIKSTKLTK